MEKVEKAAVVFIRQARQLGQTDKQIIETLLLQGVSEQDIKDAFQEMEALNSAPPRLGVYPSTPTLQIPDKGFPIKKLGIALVILILLTGIGWGTFNLISSKMLQGKKPSSSPGASRFSQEGEIKYNVLFSYQDLQLRITKSKILPGSSFANNPDIPPNISDKSILLVYYSVANNGTGLQGFWNNGIKDSSAKLYAGEKPIESDPEFSKQSLSELTELLPGQFTSNALLLDIPASITDPAGLYLEFDFDQPSGQKEYIKL